MVFYPYYQKFPFILEKISKLINEKAFKELKYSNINISIARCFTFVGKFLPRGKTNITKGYLAGNFIDNIIKKKIFL